MNKQWYKDRIYSYQCRAVSEITSALLTHTPKRQVLKQLRRIMISFASTVRLDRSESNSLWIWTVNTYTRMSKKTWGQKEEAKVQDAAIAQYRAIEKEKNDVADHIEFRIKHDRAISYEKSDTVFYQLSTHEDCAEDHAPYQGHIFINEDAATEEQKDFARIHNIPSIHEMMFNEPFLTTRRNCKHVFLPVPTDEVLNNSLPEPTIISARPLNTRYRAYVDRKKLLEAAGVSQKNDSLKRTVSLIKKYRRIKG